MYMYASVLTGPSAECQRHVCENGGRCEQQWSSFKCDCAMTSFTGSSCRDGQLSKNALPASSLRKRGNIPAARGSKRLSAAKLLSGNQCLNTGQYYSHINRTISLRFPAQRL